MFSFGYPGAAGRCFNVFFRKTYFRIMDHGGGGEGPMIDIAKIQLKKFRIGNIQRIVTHLFLKRSNKINLPRPLASGRVEV